MQECRAEVNVQLNRTALYALHQEYQAKMVTFAGYQMPLYYQHGIIHEHKHTRTKAGLFDISHMGQVFISGTSAAEQISRLTPTDLSRLQPGQQKYTVLTNPEGGIIDDLVVTNTGTELVLVVNAANKAKVVQYLYDQVSYVELREDQALLALQGPLSETILKDLAPEVADLRFMEAAKINILGITCDISRSGYTGEDGFEISLANDQAEVLARRLVQSDNVEFIGLGARDTLRLEAGLCLHGNELDTKITPVEAGLSWIITPEHSLYPGADIIQQTHRLRQRIGLRVIGKIPVRKGAVLCNSDGAVVGKVTSGSFAPTLGTPIAMAYIENAYINHGMHLYSIVRNKRVELVVTKLPFVAHRYCRRST